MIFSLFFFHFGIVEIVLFGVLFLLFSIQLFYYLYYYSGVKRWSKRIDKNEVNFNTSFPPISVIMCVRDEAENLRKFLPFILTQEYPEYEVIVVNDGSTDDTDDLLQMMTKKYANLRITFVPLGAKNQSTKKLGLTLGIKAARHKHLLFTDGDCMPEGSLWLSKMSAQFVDNIDFVVGYGGYLKEKGFLNTAIAYETLFNAMQFLGMATVGKAYMGVGRNMAYTKEVFLKNGGFTPTLHLKSGDDDLLVNRLATSENVRVCTSKDGVTWSVPKKTLRQWITQKERHFSVSQYYSTDSKMRLAIEPISRFFYYLSLILIPIFGNILTIGAATIVYLIRLAIQFNVINKTAKQLGERRFGFSVPLLDLLLPMLNLHLLLWGKKKGNRISWK